MGGVHLAACAGSGVGMHGGGGGMAACGCTLTSHVRMWARAAALTCAVRRCRARSAQRCKTETPAAAEAAWGTGQRSSVVLWHRLVARRRGRALLVVFQPLLLHPGSLGSLLVPPDAGLAACFFDRSLLTKGMQLLHHIRLERSGHRGGSTGRLQWHSSPVHRNGGCPWWS